MKRRTIVLALLVAVAALGGFGWTQLRAPAAEVRPAIARAKVATLRETVLASGMLEAKRLVSVGARVSGQIKTLEIKLGDQVEQGQLLAQIDSRDQENAVLQAEASMAQIKAQITSKQSSLKRATQTLDRQTTLGKRDLTTSDLLESAEAEVKMIEADLEALQAQLSSAEVSVANAKVALERTQITSPIKGTVVAVVVKEGQTVNASQQAPTIVKIADLSTMIVKAEISEADVMKVKAGQEASFTTLGAPGQPFEAVVRGIEPAPTAIETADTISSDSAVYYNGLLEVDNPDGQLRIGMSAEVSIERAVAEGALTVPAAAVKTDREGTYVEVFDRTLNSRERRAVTTGLTDKVTTQITEGLTEGEAVVIGAARSSAGGAPQGGRGPRGMPPPMF